MRLRLGTRGSALARAQSAWTAERMRRAHPGLEVELVYIQTTGDRGGARAGENVKASFIKEIEEALLDGTVDAAVHSSKDLPARLPDGLVLAAYPEREDAGDVFVGRGGRSLESLPAGARVGTGSLRRRIQLELARPELRFEPLRGNVDTRLRKLEAGEFDGVVLAAAGLKRLGLGVARQALPEELLIPAPGQGALALEAREDRPDVLDVLRALDHAPTRLEVELERAFLGRMGADCSTPLGARARSGAGSLSLSVFWAAPDGSRSRRASGECPAEPRAEAELVERLARQVSP